MNIGAIGWWSYDNQGDLAMLAALRQGLAPHHVVPIDIGFPAHPDTLYRLNRLDYVILGGGTLIPGKPAEPFDTFDRWADQLTCPLGVVGLGVDPIAEQHWPAVETLLARAQFFFVRDQASRKLLRDHPKIQTAPDLTFAYPLPACVNSSDAKAALPVCGVNLRWSTSLDPTPWLEAIARLPVRARGIPLSSFDVWTERALLKQLDPESAEHFQAGLYQGLDLMIGVAFHSILFAVQAAVPVIAIDYAPKVRNFMQDNGLAHYLLAPRDDGELARLVAEVLENRSRIEDELCAIGAQLHAEAQQNVNSVRERIEQSSRDHNCTGSAVTIVVIGSGDDAQNQRTLDSCAAQTYENVEVLFAGTEPPASTGTRLHRALAQSKGGYLTWVDGGDRLADDALDCLVSRLEQEPRCDMTYADYYFMDEMNLPRGYHTVAEPDKLYRRDVVGPCFLLRKELLSRLTQPIADTELPGYELWLQTVSKGVLRAFHAPLFYSTRQIKSRVFLEQEREVRRRWRRTLPAWARVFWRVVDTDLGERLLVSPLARLLRVWKRKSYVERR